MKTARISKRLISLLLVIMLLCSLTLPVLADNSNTGSGLTWEKVDNDAVKTSPINKADDDSDDPEYADTDIVRVSIVLDKASTVAAGYSTSHIASNAQAMSYRASLKAQQDAMANTISAKVLGGEKLDVKWNLTLAANIISANVPYGAIDQIKALDGVKNVVIETRYEPQGASTGSADPNMATSTVMTGSATAWANGYTGAGSRVAIIDTGLDTDHQSFANDAYLYSLEKNAEELGIDYDVYVNSLNLLTQAEVEAHWNELNFASVYSGDVANTNFSEKVPYGANYVDEGIEITHDKDNQGEHGSHVAGIAAANSYIPAENDTFVPALDSVMTQGVAPDAQLLIMKVFGVNGGAFDSDYMAAIEDAIVLDADVVNLSLGSGNAGFATSTDYQDIMDDLANSDTVVSISAGNSGMYGDGNLPIYGYLYSDGANFATNGSPGSFTNAFTVASVDNDGFTGSYFKHGDMSVFYTESDYSNDPISSLAGEQEYIFVDSIGSEEDFAAVSDVLEGKVAFCWRGTTSFYEKAEAAVANGAIATIVCNNQAGTINMDLSDYTKTAPCISILQSDAKAIMAASTPVTDDDGNVLYYTGKITIEEGIGSTYYGSEYYTMSEFSSWGVPGSLELKPEITAPGGSIYSVNGAIAGGKAYEVMSGTSMAAPQIAGMSALVAQYIRENHLDEKTGLSPRQLTQSLLMSTATPLIEADSECYYSVMKQGAGLANVDAAINADSYIMMGSDATKSAADGKIKAELGDDPDRTGSYSFSFTVNNMTDSAKSYDISSSFFTQDIFSYSGITLLDTWTVPLNFNASYTVNGAAVTPANVEALAAYDFDGNGSITTADGQALLNYITGVYESIENLDAADIDGDGDVDTHDAYEFFKVLNTGSVVVPAYASVTVTVSVQLLNIADYDDNGAYVEGYVFLDELTSADGALGESHSIPVLGYYGGWDEPSMFDVGSFLEYYYGIEDRPPYVYTSAGDATLYNQAYIVNYAGDSASYYFGGNPVADEETYMPERNAINGENGDKIGKVTFTAVRNAGASRFTITDSEGNYYMDEELGMVSAAYYYTNGSSWQGTKSSLSVGFAPTGIPEGTKLNMALTLAPEYFVKADGSVDWDSLHENASFSMPVTIDNTAPEISDIALVKSFKTGETTIDVTASDNQYIAGVFLYDSTGKLLDGYGSDEDAEAGQTSVYKFSLKDVDKYLIQVYDYAANCSSYKINLDSADAAGEIAVALDKDSMKLIKGTTGKLTVNVTPWGTPDETVTWASDNEAVATVNKYGIVTGVGAGTCNITATSVADPTKSASCAVTVETVKLTVSGALQDEDGNPLLFTWDMENDATWTSYASLQSDINAFVYDWYANDGRYAYQMNTDGYLYTIDVNTGDTVARSDAPVDFGAPLNDLEMAYQFNSTYDVDYMFGIYGAYLLYGTVSDNDFSSGWNMAGYLANYSGASEFTSIAWVGTARNSAGNVVDVFLLTTDTGDIWYIAPDLITGNAGLNFYISDLDLEWPGYGGTPYCSMVLGDDYNLYLSYFDGDTNEIYRLEEADPEVTGGYEYLSTSLGNVGSGVWPCALGAVVPNDGEEEASLAGHEIKGLDFIATAKAQSLKADTKAAAGGLNAVSGEAKIAAPIDKIAPLSTGTVGSGEQTVTVEITAKDAELNSVASTNGLFEITASDALTLSGHSVNSDYASYKNGESLIIAYADLEGFAADEVIATITYTVNSVDDASVTIKHLQVNNDAIEVEEVLDISAEFKHDNTEVRGAVAPTCTEDGYSGDVYCLDCGKLILEGTVIPATKHADDPFSDIANSGYHDAILEAAELGIVNGYADGTFKPNNDVTRAQFVTMLWRAAGSPAPKSDEVSFTDADKIAEPFVQAVAWGAENGIISGYADGSFKPNESVSRAQMATFLYRYLKNVVGYDFGEVNAAEFDDVADIAAPYVDAVNAIVSAGIMNGVSESEFAPNDFAVRGSVALALVRIINLQTA